VGTSPTHQLFFPETAGDDAQGISQEKNGLHNCQISPLDIQPQKLEHKAYICLGILDSYD
jgi:hypothetical protein